MPSAFEGTNPSVPAQEEELASNARVELEKFRDMDSDYPHFPKVAPQTVDAAYAGGYRSGWMRAIRLHAEKPIRVAYARRILQDMVQVRPEYGGHKNRALVAKAWNVDVADLS